MKRIELHEDGLEAFREAAAGDETFKLVATCTPSELYEAIAFVGRERRIKALKWTYRGDEPVSLVVPPASLIALEMNFNDEVEYFLAEQAMRVCPGLVELKLAHVTESANKRFFDTLGGSAVTSLELPYSPKISRDLLTFLQKDRLEELSLPAYSLYETKALIEVLYNCTRLTKLSLSYVSLLSPHFPQRLTKLSLNNVAFHPDFDWSLVIGSTLTDLYLGWTMGMSPARVVAALTAHLSLRSMEHLTLEYPLTLPPEAISRVRHLDLRTSSEMVGVVATALQSPGNELRRLGLTPSQGISSVNLQSLNAALRQNNCKLTELHIFSENPEVLVLERRFNDTQALFVLLQGQQVPAGRRRFNRGLIEMFGGLGLGNEAARVHLQRLPVEMFRLVGMMLI